jgi:ABC-2 type transport system permease protein
VGLVGPSAQALGPALHSTAAAAKVSIRVVDIADSQAATSAVKDGSVGIALTVRARSAVAEVKQTLSSTMRALLQATLDEAHQRQVLAGAGVSPSLILQAQAPVPLATAARQPPPADQAARSIAALAAGILLYLSLALYAAAVANGVAQEKTSRTAEVLLAAVRPSQLLNGKVLGIGACGLGQLAIAVGAGLIANAAVQRAEIPSIIWVLLPAILLWFVLGFALYAFACAAAGAMVARQEEVQFVTLPISMPLVVGYVLMFPAIASPDAWWVRVLSFLPPFAPIFMPARLALGHMGAWEMPLAVLIMAAAVYGTSRLAARVYAGALVRSGARLSWRAALRLRGAE